MPSSLKAFQLSLDNNNNYKTNKYKAISINK